MFVDWCLPTSRCASAQLLNVSRGNGVPSLLQHLTLLRQRPIPYNGFQQHRHMRLRYIDGFTTRFIGSVMPRSENRPDDAVLQVATSGQ